MLEHILFFCVLTVLVGLYLWIKALLENVLKSKKKKTKKKKKRERKPPW